MPDFFDRLADELVRVASIPAVEGVAPLPAPARDRRWLNAHWRRRRLNGPLIAILALVGSVGTIGGLAAAGVLPKIISDQQYANGGRVQIDTAITPAEKAAFGILRRPRVPSDAYPRSLLHLYGEIYPQAGSNAGLSRRAQGLGSPAWIIAANDNILCLIAVGGGDCSPLQPAERGLLATFNGGRKAHGGVRMAGVVPDGVSTVTIHSNNGSTVTVRVHDNVYVAFVPGGFESLWFRKRNGQRYWVG